MKKAEEMAFSGFTPVALEFLRDVKFNNSKDWYEEHKEVYRESVLKPFQQLVMDLSDVMLAIDPHVDTRPAVDRTISRIRRDTRFSKDKTLYRENVWISFKRLVDDWKETPVYFFEISPTWYRYGMGFWYAPKPAMDHMRELIDRNDKDFMEVFEEYRNQKLLKLEGQAYKRSLPGTRTPELAEWYQKKDIYFMNTKKVDEKLFCKALVDEVSTGFLMLKPYYDFLWRLVEETR